jgi:hypothetical protein
MENHACVEVQTCLPDSFLLDDCRRMKRRMSERERIV